MFSRRKSVAIAVGAAAVAALGFSVYTASASATAAPPYTCNGGSIPGGTYSSLTVKGDCHVDDGDVHVTGDVAVQRNAQLIAAYGGSDFLVGGSVRAGQGSTLVFGCDPYDFMCAGGQESGYSTTTIQHDLVASGARAILVHDSHIGGSVTQTGGGGGLSCGEPEVAQAALDQEVEPAYTTYSDTSIGGDLTITGVKTCWMGVTRVRVGQSMTYTGNKTGDPDGNELVTNRIARNLACVGNKPAPQIGDSGGNLNSVGGLATGQCKNLAGAIKTTTVTDDAPRG